MSVAKFPVMVRRVGAAAVLLLAAILWPPRVGEPDRAEAVAIAVVRAIISGELAHASLNEGYFDTLQCLESGSCAPGPPHHGAFLARDFQERYFAPTSGQHGYRFEFHAGPKPVPQRDRRVSPSAMTSFAVVAIPLSPQLQQHSFCGDDRGTIYLIGGGALPRVEAGRCVDTRQSVANLRSAAKLSSFCNMPPHNIAMEPVASATAHRGDVGQTDPTERSHSLVPSPVVTPCLSRF